MTSSPLVIFTMYVYLRDFSPLAVSNTIRSIGSHVSLANGYSSTYKLKELVGEPVNPFKSRTMVQVCSFVSRSRFSDTRVHQKKGRRTLSTPSKNCISSSPTPEKQPIRRRIVSTKSSLLEMANTVNEDVRANKLILDWLPGEFRRRALG